MASQELVVELAGRRVGTLASTRRGARFAYDEDIVQRMAGRPLLSLSLPVKRRPYAEGFTGSWFRGLLPEGERLQSVCRAIGCDPNDYVSVLEHVGWECAGAVSIHAPGFSLPSQTRPLALSDEALVQKLRDLPAYGGIEPYARVSLGGYQEKLLVVARDLVVKDGFVAQAKWEEPAASVPTTHIIKPQPHARYKGIVEAEAWAMEVAKGAARCANVALLQLDDAPLSLVVERYDRVWHDGACERVHQEDCCQAMGIDPRDKYAGADAVRGSDPSYAKIAALLDAYADNPEEEKAELLRQLVVNLVLGNVDAHAKNYAVVFWRPMMPSMSPLYDVVPVVDVEPRARHLSMRVGGVLEFEKAGREEVLAEAVLWGMPRTQAVRVVDRVLERLWTALSAAADRYPRAAGRHASSAEKRLLALMRER